ncbi:hypothetical protein IFM89_013564 [Coptis chinensis]|uniref:SOSEKI DIX-like domain-containing protein n=1 Tax=Coptis chinensis TaxID=261450 RepID=A0A835LZV4_9MAGN|nr:hypothetical protein IFM89_013564 [Coptis chinensis]
MEGKGEVGNDGRESGEVRRVHIIYFLSRMGRVEQPHLIRVHHVSRNGIHLKDVKRWLSELRGKNMPDSFSWSYKRKYKSGYVWQDLMDEDLITPISDNEFVLKGSEIPAISFDSCSCGKKIRNEGKPEQALTKSTEQNNSYTSSTKTSHTEEDSGPLDSETSASTEESFKTSAVFTPDISSYLKTNTASTEIEELNEDVVEKCYLNKEEEAEKARQQAWSFNKRKSKSYSNGGSNVFRNLLNCGATETNDSAIMMVNKSGPLGTFSPLNNTSEICRVDTLGGSERIVSAAAWNQQQAQYARKSFSGTRSKKKSNEFANKNKISAAYKPVREPHCS